MTTKNKSVRLNSDDGFKKYEKLIYKICHSFTKTTTIEFEEALSIAHESFMNAVNSYNPMKSKFNTHLGNIVRNDIGNYLKAGRTQKRFSHQMDLENIKEPGYFDDPTFAIDFKNWKKSSLSEEALGVVDILLSCPIELTELVTTGGSNNDSLTKIGAGLRKFLTKLGWETWKIQNVFGEIKTALEIL